MSRMTTVSKQNAQTWANLHSRLMSSPFDYCHLFPERVRNFFKDHALAISTCEGYLVDSVLATSAYLISEKSSIEYNGMSTKANIYLLFVGPPSTGKSQAIQVGTTDPLHAIDTARDNTLSLSIGKSTSAGLFSRLAEGDGMMVSSEIHDILLKMAKNDGENASGDIATLCHLFSGEKVSTTYATQNKKEIEAGRAFSILGATQPGPAAHLLTALDTGNGMIERLLIHFPDCLRPFPKDTRQARRRLLESGSPSITYVLQVVENLHEKGVKYSFSEDCEEELDKQNELYIEAINQAIVDGISPPQTKKIDLLIRLAAPIHVLNSVVEDLLMGRQPDAPNQLIGLESLVAAQKLVEHVEGQKETFLTELRDMTTQVTTPVKDQPKPITVAASVVRTPGRVLTYRSFKSTCVKSMRSVSSVEFSRALTDLKDVGEVSSIRSGPNSRTSVVFVKKDPDMIDWDSFGIVSREIYTAAYLKNVPSCVSKNMRNALIQSGKCTDMILSD
nr:uncharacterized protein LOC129268685 [Lytechinus pictus]